MYHFPHFQYIYNFTNNELAIKNLNDFLYYLLEYIFQVRLIYYLKALYLLFLFILSSYF